MSLYALMRSELDRLDKLGLKRSINCRAQCGSFIDVDGKKLVNLSSNDYLGFAQDKDIQQAFLKSIPDDAVRFSSSGSPLLTGAMPSYERAMNRASSYFKRPCLFFNTGFSANYGVVNALSLPDTLILADRLVHASIIDGMISGKGKYRRFAHNDLDDLERLINANYQQYENILVVTESVFSMDGDIADLKGLSSLKKKFDNVYLYLDEAHSFGLYGKNGAGLASSLGIADDFDFILCTLGKGLGSQGAFLVTSEVAREYLICKVRPLIFSTAMSPAAFEHVNYMLGQCEQAAERRKRLGDIVSYIHSLLRQNDFEDRSQSQIIPILAYDNNSALKAFEFFKEQGFYAMPVRYPTVPKGQARLRMSLTASLSDDMVNALGEAVCKFKKII